MLEILSGDVVESDDQLIELADWYGRLVIPSENDDLELTHWWLIREEAREALYVGTPETFTNYVRERNGGVQ